MSIAIQPKIYTDQPRSLVCSERDFLLVVPTYYSSYSFGDIRRADPMFNQSPLVRIGQSGASQKIAERLSPAARFLFFTNYACVSYRIEPGLQSKPYSQISCKAGLGGFLLLTSLQSV